MEKPTQAMYSRETVRLLIDRALYLGRLAEIFVGSDQQYSENELAVGAVTMLTQPGVWAREVMLHPPHYMTCRETTKSGAIEGVGVYTCGCVLHGLAEGLLDYDGPVWQPGDEEGSDATN
jgi:hypothetical protein